MLMLVGVGAASCVCGIATAESAREADKTDTLCALCWPVRFYVTISDGKIAPY